MSKDNTAVTLTEYGAGKQGEHATTMGALTQSSGVTPKQGRLLYALTHHFKPTTILELGTGPGISSLYLHYGAPKSHFSTIEACAGRRAIAQKSFKLAHTTAIHQLSGVFEKVLPDYLQNHHPELVFIDGNHQYQPVVDYVMQLTQQDIPPRVIILHDIHWSAGMVRAWNTLRKLEQYHVTIDLFHTGVLLRRPGQVKEHFILKN